MCMRLGRRCRTFMQKARFAAGQDDSPFFNTFHDDQIRWDETVICETSLNVQTVASLEIGHWWCKVVQCPKEQNLKGGPTRTSG